MASSSKRKTTMAKLNRERAVVERRLRKQAKKDARKQAAAAAAASPGADGDTVTLDAGETVTEDR
jgi:DeoR/GlpR family transcriptional regulator of sugar metabolism